jgi:cytochrome c556
MKRNAILTWSALAVVIPFSVAVVAQEMRPDRAIKYRQAVMYAMNANVAILGAMAKGDVPYNKDRAVRSAEFVSQLAAMPVDGFVPVSPKAGTSKAKPEIWTDKAKFDKLAESLQAETPKLVAAARTGELSQLRSALSAVGKICNDCHDDFRIE